MAGNTEELGELEIVKQLGDLVSGRGNMTIIKDPVPFL